MSGKISKVLQQRCEELELHAAAMASAIEGKCGAEWDKFGDEHDVATVPTDMFSRDEMNAEYVAAVDKAGTGSQKRAQVAKWQADMLSAMQRGTVMRYSRSRVWAMAAAYSRSTALAASRQIRRLPDFIAAMS